MPTSLDRFFLPLSFSRIATDNVGKVQVAPAITAIEQNRDVIVGVKIRLTANIANDGQNEKLAFERALEVARRTGLPLMTHHALSSIEHEGDNGCPVSHE